MVEEVGGGVGFGFGWLKMFHGRSWSSQGTGFVIILHGEEGSGMNSGTRSRNHRVANICRSNNFPAEKLSGDQLAK